MAVNQITAVNGCKQMWTGVNGCERMWTDMNGCERMWTDVYGCELMWTGVNGCELIWTVVNSCERLWIDVNWFEDIRDKPPRRILFLIRSTGSHGMQGESVEGVQSRGVAGCRSSPPTAITSLDSDGYWQATKPPRTSPLLVFINSKSGAKQVRIWHKYNTNLLVIGNRPILFIFHAVT